jgi:Leucine-rich repeat (LRR) protein
MLNITIQHMFMHVRFILIIAVSLLFIDSCSQPRKETETANIRDSAEYSGDMADTAEQVTGRNDQEKSSSPNNNAPVEEGSGLKTGISRPEQVLDILPLYRAKRYESVQEAVNAKDTVYKLILYGQKLGHISPDIARLRFLNSLDLSYNDLTGIPQDIKGLEYLQGLYVKGNQISYIPEFVYDFSYMYRLDLSENAINEVSPEIYRLSELTVLNLESNRLAEIPTEIYNLSLLNALHLNNNLLTGLPEGISGLSRLTKLYLEHNRLTALPEDLGYMTHLEELWLQGNDIPAGKIAELQEKLPYTKIRY